MEYSNINIEVLLSENEIVGFLLLRPTMLVFSKEGVKLNCFDEAMEIEENSRCITEFCMELSDSNWFENRCCCILLTWLFETIQYLQYSHFIDLFDLLTTPWSKDQAAAFLKSIQWWSSSIQHFLKTSYIHSKSQVWDDVAALKMLF